MGPALDTLSDGLIIGRCRCLNAKHTSKKKVQFVKHTLKFLKRVVLHVVHVAQGAGHGGIESEALGIDAVGSMT